MRRTPMEVLASLANDADRPESTVGDLMSDTSSVWGAESVARDGSEYADPPAGPDPTPARVRYESGPRIGLRVGDVVALLEPEGRGVMHVHVEEVQAENGTTQRVFVFRGGPLEGWDGEPDTLASFPEAHLEVFRNGDALGLRSASAGGRFLQATRRGAARLRFTNRNFGISEHWDVVAGGRDLGTKEWALKSVTLRSRRLAGVSLRARAARVGYVEDARNALLTPRSYALGGSDDGQASVMGAMSGLLVREWVAALDAEVAVRQGLEQELHAQILEREALRQRLSEEIGEVRSSAAADLEAAIAELQARDAQLREAAAAAARLERRAVATMAEAVRCMRRHFSQRAARRCLHEWRFLAVRVSSDESHAAVLRRKVGDLARARAFAAWRVRAVERRARLHDAAASGLRHAARLARGAVLAWRGYVAGELRHRHLVARAQARRARHLAEGSLSQWRGLVRMLEAKAKAGHAKHTARLARGALLGWSGEVGRSFRLAKLKQWFEGRTDRYMRQRACRAWKLHVAGVSRQQQLIARSLANHNTLTARNVVDQWHGLVKMWRLKTKVVCAKHTAHLLRAALLDWHFEVQRTGKLQYVELFFGARDDRRTRQRMWRAWKLYVAGVSRQQQLIARSIERHAMQLVAGALRQWAGLMGLSRQQALTREMRERAIDKRLELLGFRTAAAVMRSWVALWRRERALRVSYQRVVRSNVRRSLAHALAGWRSWNDGVQQGKELLERFAARVLNSAALKALRGWSHAVQRLAWMRHTAETALRHMLAAVLRSSFRRWAGVCAARAASKGRVVARMRNVRLSASVAAWAAAASELRRQRRLLRRAVGAGRHRACSAAFRRWKEHVGELLRQDRLVCKVWQRHRMRYSSRAFSGWAAATAELARQRRLVNRVLAHALQRHTARALGTWAEVARERAWQRRVATRAAARIGNRLAARALEAWALLHREGKRRLQLMAKAYGFLRSRVTSIAFSTWAYVALTTAKDARQNAIERMLGRRLRGVLTEWHVMAHHTRRYRSLLSRSLRRIKDDCASLHLRAWAALARAGRLHSKWAARLSRRELSAAWAAWATHVAGLRRQRVLLSRAVHMFAQNVLARALATWVAAVDERRQELQKMRRAANMMARRRATMAVSRWAEGAAELRRKRNALRRAAAYFTRREQARVFRAWDALGQRRRRERRVVANALARLRLRSESRAVSAWRANAATAKRVRRMTARAINYCAETRVRTAFELWHDFVAGEGRARWAVRRAARTYSRSLARRALLHWASTLQEERHYAGLVGRLLGRRGERLARLAVRHWASYVASVAQLAALLGASAANASRRGLRGVLREWRAEALAARGVQLQVSRCVARQQRRAHVLRFRLWAAFTARARCTRVAVARWTGSRDKAAAREALELWCGAVEGRKAKLRTLRQCLVRKRVSQRFFMRWYWDAFDEEIQSALGAILGRTDAAQHTKLRPSIPRGAGRASRSPEGDKENDNAYRAAAQAARAKAEKESASAMRLASSLHRRGQHMQAEEHERVAGLYGRSAAAYGRLSHASSSGGAAAAQPEGSTFSTPVVNPALALHFDD